MEEQKQHSSNLISGAHETAAGEKNFIFIPPDALLWGGPRKSNRDYYSGDVNRGGIFLPEKKLPASDEEIKNYLKENYESFKQNYTQSLHNLKGFEEAFFPVTLTNKDTANSACIEGCNRECIVIQDKNLKGHPSVSLEVKYRTIVVGSIGSTIDPLYFFPGKVKYQYLLTSNEAQPPVYYFRATEVECSNSVLLRVLDESKENQAINQKDLEHNIEKMNDKEFKAFVNKTREELENLINKAKQEEAEKNPQNLVDYYCDIAQELVFNHSLRAFRDDEKGKNTSDFSKIKVKYLKEILEFLEKNSDLTIPPVFELLIEALFEGIAPGNKNKALKEKFQKIKSRILATKDLNDPFYYQSKAESLVEIYQSLSINNRLHFAENVFFQKQFISIINSLANSEAKIDDNFAETLSLLADKIFKLEEKNPNLLAFLEQIITKQNHLKTTEKEFVPIRFLNTYTVNTALKEGEKIGDVRIEKNEYPDESEFRQKNLLQMMTRHQVPREFDGVATSDKNYTFSEEIEQIKKDFNGSKSTENSRTQMGASAEVKSEVKEISEMSSPEASMEIEIQFPDKKVERIIGNFQQYNSFKEKLKTKWKLPLSDTTPSNSSTTQEQVQEKESEISLPLQLYFKTFFNQRGLERTEGFFLNYLVEILPKYCDEKETIIKQVITEKKISIHFQDPKTAIITFHIDGFKNQKDGEKLYSQTFSFCITDNYPEGTENANVKALNDLINPSENKKDVQEKEESKKSKEESSLYYDLEKINITLIKHEAQLSASYKKVVSDSATKGLEEFLKDYLAKEPQTKNKLFFQESIKLLFEGYGEQTMTEIIKNKMLHYYQFSTISQRLVINTEKINNKTLLSDLLLLLHYGLDPLSKVLAYRQLTQTSEGLEIISNSLQYKYPDYNKCGFKKTMVMFLFNRLINPKEFLDIVKGDAKLLKSSIKEFGDLFKALKPIVEEVEYKKLEKIAEDLLAEATVSVKNIPPKTLKPLQKLLPENTSERLSGKSERNSVQIEKNTAAKLSGSTSSKRNSLSDSDIRIQTPTFKKQDSKEIKTKKTTQENLEKSTSKIKAILKSLRNFLRTISSRSSGLGVLAAQSQDKNSAKKPSPK